MKINKIRYAVFAAWAVIYSDVTYSQDDDDLETRMAAIRAQVSRLQGINDDLGASYTNLLPAAEAWKFEFGRYLQDFPGQEEVYDAQIKAINDAANKAKHEFYGDNDPWG